MAKTESQSTDCNDVSQLPLSGSSSERCLRWVEEHGDYLFRYALKHCKARETAEEFVQETFLAALKAADSFQERSTVRTWLTSILRFKIIDHFRRSKHFAVPLPDDSKDVFERYFDEVDHWRAEKNPREWNLNPETVVQNQQFLKVLNGCLGKLPDRCREVFVLREVDGCSREEIAGDLSLSSNNVGVILHRARLLIRECVQMHWLK